MLSARLDAKVQVLTLIPSMTIPDHNPNPLTLTLTGEGQTPSRYRAAPVRIDESSNPVLRRNRAIDQAMAAYNKDEIETAGTKLHMLGMEEHGRRMEVHDLEMQFSQAMGPSLV